MIVSSRIDMYHGAPVKHIVGLDSLQRGAYIFANCYIAIGLNFLFFFY